VTVNLDEETLQKEYGGELQPIMRGSLSNLIAKTFKVIAKKKVFIPGKFANANEQACVKCAVRANEGLLYPLEKQFVFIHKPPIIVRFQEVESVEFQRYAGGQGSTRNFDLCVNLKPSASAGGVIKDYTFSGIDRSDYASLYNFLSGKKIPIKNLQGNSFMDDVTTVPREPVYNEDEIFGVTPAVGAGGAGGGAGGDDDEEGSEDESYDEKAAEEDAEGGSSASEEMDDEELGSEVDEELDSDLEEYKKKEKKKEKSVGGGAPIGKKSDKADAAAASKPKKKPKRPKDDSDNDDDDDDDEDAAPKKKRKKKDPNAPKRAMSAYMFYVNSNRDKVKSQNPDATFGDLVRRLK